MFYNCISNQTNRYKIMTNLTKNFPITFKVTVFPQDADKRDLFLASYFYETIVNNESEERKFYESFDGDQNLILETI